MSVTAIIFAFLTDLVIGDPVWRFHPARLMGRFIEKGEDFLRDNMDNEKFDGAILAIGLPIFVFCLMWCFIFVLGKIHFILAWLASVLGIYFSISIHDLNKEASQIFADLSRVDHEQAKKDLARIVGRDTDHLSQEETIRACVETVAESTVDGIIAPLFYAALGGAPLALAYKAVNTLDSMIGHKNERYKDFGFVAAKQDDFFNWIPARISYGVISIASILAKQRTKKAFKIGWRDGIIASYGNSAIPIAAFAGALGLRLGGRNTYKGIIVKKPFLGEPGRSFDNGAIMESIRLMQDTAWMALMLCIMIHLIFT